jgi:peptidoglycan/xylan/chitin deacetylase (PgdA/CDA1 family)
MNGVPILMYHRLFAEPAELFGWPRAITRHWVSVADFASQMRALADHGYSAISLSSLLAGAPFTKAAKPLVVTFDDGWQSDLRHARPILDRLGWPSEHFVTVGWIGTDAFVSWAELGKLAETGAGIHSHSLTHRDFDRLPPSEVRHELDSSKTWLEQRLGRPVEFLALPGGTGASASVRVIARACGYRGICTSKVGLNVPGVADPFALRRLPVTRGTPLRSLLAWVAGREVDRLVLSRESLRVARAIVPSALYGYLRELVLR